MIGFHPLANLFPLIEGPEFDALVADMREGGFRAEEQIVILDGQILDGRNRYRAGIAAGVFGPDETWRGRWEFCEFSTGADSLFDARTIARGPLAYVISKNLHRRQLNESQRAMVAAKLATMEKGARTDLEPCSDSSKVSQPEAATLLNVSRTSLQSAKSIQADGVDELNRKVELGELRISTAALIARLPKEEQAALLAHAAPQAVKAAAKKINAQAREERRVKVNALHASLSANSGPLPRDRKYPVIYADPATRFEAGFGDRSIENHYPTDTIEEWCKLPVGDLALPDARLFVWTTVPQLARTIELLLPAWGFTYVSCACWDKTSPDHAREAATGYWFRNQHEILLLATRGAPTLPPPADVPLSMYRERKTAHSAKPDYYRAMIEAMTPGLPRIELFARTKRDGWDAWGNQAQTESQAKEPKAGAGSTAIEEGPSGVVRVGEAHAGAPATSEDGRDSRRDGTSFAPLDAACCARDAVAAAVPDMSPVPKQSLADMAIPAFLRRSKDNTLPDKVTS